MDPKSQIRVEISYKTVVFTVAFLAGLWFLVQIKDIIILVFLSLLLLAAFLKPVEWLTRHKVPRILAIIIVYLILIAFISFAIGIIIPPLVSQTSDLISKFPQIISTINDFLIFNKIPVQDLSRTLSGQIQQVISNVFSISKAIFSSIFLVMTLFVFTFYLLLEWKKVIKLTSSPFSGRQEKLIANIISKVENGLGHWVRGQLSLSVIVGLLTLIGLTILGIPYALPLALVAGILEIVPIIGPIVSAIPAILVALTISPVLALAVIALFFIVQQLENHLIVPFVMSKVVGLQPPVVIISLLIGAKLAGIGGAFLAVPVVVVGKIVLQEIFNQEQKLDEELKEY